MIKNVKFDVTFKTGKSFSRDLSFDNGLTIISGRNEAGKSLVLEMINYALFGTSFLRGVSDTYLKLSVTLDFAINGVDYRVYRNKEKNKVTLTGENLDVVGTKQVNQKIMSLFGYNSNVYSLANFCGQNQIDALAAMDAGSRKKLIDKTLGLEALDALTVWVSDKVKTMRGQIDALTKMLGGEPQPPAPLGTASLEVIEGLLNPLVAAKAEATLAQKWLDTHRVELPRHPTRPNHSWSLEELIEKKKQKEAISKFIVGDRKRLEKRWERYHLAEEYRRQFAGISDPKVSEKTYLLYMEWETYLSNLKRYESAPTCICEQCGHVNVLTDQSKPVPPEGKQPIKTWDNSVTVEKIRQWEASLPVRVTYSDLVPEDFVNPSIPEEYLGLVYSEEEVRKFREEVGFEDFDALISEFKFYESKMKTFEVEIAKYKILSEHEDENKKLAARLPELTSEVERLSNLKTEAIRYQEALKVFEQAKILYDCQKSDLETVSVKYQHWVLMKEKIAEVRQTIKGMFLPSLNQVASLLVQQMTAGKHQVVTISEDFADIVVDGDDIETLSGSTANVVYLATRLALGLVLTNRVFSVFMGDELDSATDSERAEAIASALKSLTNTIGQVIVVSHKSVEGDNNIFLEG